MKQIAAFITLVTALVLHVQIKAQITYNFTNANASSGVPAGITASAITQVNNNGTTTFIAAGTPASSGYTGASGGNNGNASAKIGAVSTTGTTSTYMQVVLTPAQNRWVNITAIQWGNFSLATTGPTTLSIYTSIDNYAAPIATANVTHSTTVWTLINPSFTPVNGLIGTAVTIRIYASAGTGTTPAANAVNWRMDDFKITATAQGGTVGQIPKFSDQSTFANSIISETPAGNVGIGTATPGAKLEVAGQIKITGGTPGAGKVLTSDATGLATWQTPAGGGGGSQWNTVGSDIHYSLGNVGINTSSPGANLDVNGTIKSNTGMFILNNIYGSFWDVSGTHARLWANSSTDALVLSATKATSQVRIQVNNGNRGIMMDGVSKNLLFMGGSGETLSGIGNADGTGHLAFLYSPTASTQVEGMRLTNNGNVGIGTTTPNSVFQVNYPANGVGTVTTNGTATVTGTNTQFTTNLKVGSLITINGETRTVGVITNDNTLTTTAAFTSSLSNQVFTINAPGRKFAVGERRVYIGDLVAGLGGDGGQGTSTVFGVEALQSTTFLAYQNDAFGFRAAKNTTNGFDNTALGSFSLEFNTTGISNVAIGRDAMENSVSGNYNVAIGVGAFYDFGATACNNNVAIGRSSGRGITNGSGNTIIGAWVTGLPSTLSNTVILADGSNTGTNAYRFYSPASGNVLIGSTTDAGYKFDVTGSLRNTTSAYLATASGSVGIGTTSPAAKLDVAGTFKLADGTQGAGKVLTSDANGNASWQTATGGGGFWTDAGSGNLYNTNQNGSVCIGLTTIPGDYKLAVKGNIITEKIKTRLHASGWPDFVFQEGYKLLSLEEIEQFIKQHKHLPEVPSAEEVGKNGLDLGDNQALLLKKIEELTLHMIEMNKKIENLQTENEALKKTVSTVNK